MKPNDTNDTVVKKKAPPEFVVISSKPGEVTEEQRQKFFEVFDESIDKFLAAENDEAESDTQ